MMSALKISIINQQNPGIVDEVKEVSFDELPSLITQSNWSPSEFQKSADEITHRTKASFKSVGLMVLDIDGGWSLEDAKKKVKPYCHIIATTKNHQKEKISESGSTQPACDRFRVILQLEREITNSDEYAATWEHAKKLFPALDTSCKDTSRQYFPSLNIVSESKQGSHFPVIKPKGKAMTPLSVKLAPISTGLRGALSPNTIDFIMNGGEEGKWHNRLYAAAKDFQEQNYPLAEAKKMLEGATKDYLGHLDEHDVKTIEDAYNRPTKYPLKAPPTQALSILIPTAKEMTDEMKRDQEIRDEAMANKIPFICSSFDGIFPLVNGFTLIPVMSGQGKSTAAANIAAHAIETASTKRKILFISNEESTLNVYSRIACLMAGIDWKHHREHPTHEGEKSISKFRDSLPDRVKVFSVSGKNKYDVTKLEDVIEICNEAKKQPEEYGLIIVDYLQAITHSSDKTADQYKVSKKFGDYLKSFSPSCSIPIVVFAQAYPDDSGTHISRRIQGDRTIYNHAYEVIEIIPDMDVKCSTFKIHKSREHDLATVVLGYDKGRFVPLPEGTEVSIPQKFNNAMDDI